MRNGSQLVRSHGSLWRPCLFEVGLLAYPMNDLPESDESLSAERDCCRRAGDDLSRSDLGR
jgi:hypothetical protein